MIKRMAVALLLLAVLLCLPWTAGAEPLPTLRWGSRGATVTRAQRTLNAWGYYRGPIDGIYGGRTYGAVMWFQRRNGLPVDGVIGPATWRALGMNPGAPPAAATGGGRAASRANETELLARVISAEAKGEPYEGQVAVGAVLLNRVQDARFPQTLAGVVYQPLAFEPVANGTIYHPPVASAWRAARDAVNGWDPTHGAVYFWNPATAVSRWVWSRPIHKRIGNHVFAR